jgi:uncharacterized membrane protein YhaH (DUF805 family)
MLFIFLSSRASDVLYLFAIRHTGETLINFATVLSWITAAGLTVPTLAVAVRRMHDLNGSGWWVILGLLPQMYAFFVPGRPYGPFAGWLVLLSLASVVAAVVFLVWCCQRGTAGPNRFGADPLAPEYPDLREDVDGSGSADRSPIEDDLEVVEGGEAGWYLLRGPRQVYLDIDCGYGFTDLMITLILNEDEVATYRTYGNRYLDSIANQMNYIKPTMADRDSPFKGRAFERRPSSAVSKAIQRWKQSGKPKGVL